MHSKLLHFILFLLGFGQLAQGQSCNPCSLMLPPNLPADTLLLTTAPNGIARMDYEESISFRMPMTTTPVAAVDSTTPPGIDLDEISIVDVANLPPGLVWDADKTSFDVQQETDGCITICGTPLQAGFYEVAVSVEAKVSLLTQSAEFTFPMVILPASSSNSGFELVNSVGCGEAETSFVNGNPSGGRSGFLISGTSGMERRVLMKTQGRCCMMFPVLIS